MPPVHASLINGRWRADDLPDPPDDSVVGTPARRHRSIRRTSHIDATWADGFGGPTTLRGHSRDLGTSTDGRALVVDEAGFAMELARDVTITALDVAPALVGASAMKGFRRRCAEVLPEGPLRSLLDDVAVVSRIGSIAWFLPTQRVALPPDLGSGGGEAQHQRTASGAVVCSGLRPGGFDQVNRERGVPFGHFVRPAGELASDDPSAWHELDREPATRMRRRRRTDVWRRDDRIEVDAHYRDSVWGEDGVEYAVHEYSVRAGVDAGSGRLVEIDAVAHVLPFPECPLAAAHAGLVVGTELASFRAAVPAAITGLRACTHLNDMLRGLADVPLLVDRVPV